MATEVKLPELAEGIEKGEVVAVMAKVGDEVTPDTPLIEVESDKATLPVPAGVAGKLSKLLVEKGSKIAVGETFAVIEAGGESSESDDAAASDDAKADKETKSGNGKKAKKAASGKETAPAEKPELDEAEGDESQDEIRQGVETAEEPASNDQRPVPASHNRQPGEPIPAGPTVRRIARELGIDLGIVQGSGRNGRISVEDLDPHIKGYVAKRGGAAAGGASIAPIELPDFSKFGSIRTEKADSLRRKIADKMQQSWTSVPHVHQFADADITDLLGLMKRHKDRVKEQGGALTFTVFAIKAVALALKEFPQFNTSYDPAAQQIIFKEYIHMGVAVDTPNGLIVPVIRDVDKKSLLELSKELSELAEKTRNRKTSIDDLRGGSFTISNLGGIGGTYFTPIINTPEVAIMGIGRAQKKPVFDKGGNVVARDICPICIAYDHRVIDGADGARFTTRIVEILENFEGAFLGF